MAFGERSGVFLGRINQGDASEFAQRAVEKQASHLCKPYAAVAMSTVSW